MVTLPPLLWPNQTVTPDLVRAAVTSHTRADIVAALVVAIAANRCVRVKECTALALTAPEE